MWRRTGVAISTRRQALDDALTRLARLHPKKIDLSLGRLQRLLTALGSPQESLPPTIHIAGTNGKGSTCAYLSEMSRARGETVHIYTSPHLVNFNERIRLDSRPVPDKMLIEAFARCEAANFGEPITFFEITTAAAFLLFSEHPADRLILEVGLGGRYDATNVIAKPALSVITPVSLDHQEFLGDNITDIAREKAGICKFGVPVVIGNQDDAAEEALLAEAQRAGAPAFVWGRDYNAYMQHGRLVYEDENRVWDLPAPSLIGPHQIQNAGMAAACASVLNWEESSVSTGIGKASWPGRLQNITRGPLGEIANKAGAELWLDGGHNVSAAKAAGLQAETATGLIPAVKHAAKEHPAPRILIAGSLYLAGEALALGGEPPHITPG